MRFADIKVGSIIKTACGQMYKKRSTRTIEMAAGHSHYNPDNVKWFYATADEQFSVMLGPTVGNKEAS
jgi:hypothetical protein